MLKQGRKIGAQRPCLSKGREVIIIMFLLRSLSPEGAAGPSPPLLNHGEGEMKMQTTLLL